jgi:hypothetical protein
MYIISALDLRRLYSSRTPREHHAQPIGCAHPTLETTDIAYDTKTIYGAIAIPLYLTISDRHPREHPENTALKVFVVEDSFEVASE